MSSAGRFDQRESLTATSATSPSMYGSLEPEDLGNVKDRLLTSSNQQALEDDKLPKQRTWKLFKTAALSASFLGLGLCISITGPTMPYLDKHVGVGIDKIGLIITIRSVGILLGSMGSGWLFERFSSRSDVLLCVGALGMAFGTVLTPWTVSFATLAVASAACGLAAGVVITGGNTACLRVWGTQSPPYMQALHFSFGLGCVLAPLIAAPLLEAGTKLPLSYWELNETTMIGSNSSNLKLLVTKTPSLNTSPSPDSSTSESTTWSEPLPAHIETFGPLINNVQFVYLLISGLLLPVAIGFAVLDSRRLMTSTVQAVESPSSAQHKPADKFYLVSTLVLLFLFSWLYTGVEASIGQFIATFAIKHNGFGEDDASLLTAIFWGVFTLGRGCAIFIARRLSPTKMVLGSLACSLTALTVLCFGLSSHNLVLWISIGVLGFGLAAIFPSGISWAEERLHISSTISAVFSVSSAGGDMSLPATMGYLMATVSSISMMYALLGFALLDSAIFLLCMLNKPGCKRCWRLSDAEPIAGPTESPEADGSSGHDLGH